MTDAVAARVETAAVPRAKLSSRLIWLYGRSRGVWHAVLLAGPLLIIGCALLPRTVPLLLSDTDQRLRLPAVLGLVVVILAGPGLRPCLSDAEWMFRGPLRRLRLVHIALLVVVLLALAVAVGGTARPDLAVEIAVNGAGLLGLALVTVATTALPPWLLPVALVAATYVVGSDPDTGAAHPWAWLLWTDHQGLRAGIDGALFAAGAALFVARAGDPHAEA